MVVMEATLINLTKFGKRFSISTGTLNSICSSIGIDTHKEGKELFTSFGNNFYNISTDILLLYAFYEYKATGKLDKTLSKDFLPIEIKDNNFNEILYNLETLKELVEKEKPTYQVEPNEGQVIKPTNTNAQIITRPAVEALAGTPDQHQEQLLTLLATAVARALPTPSKPVLEAQEELSKAIEGDWLLSNEQVATLLQMNKSTVSSKKTGWRKLGFEFEKIKEGKTTTLWRVKRYSI